MVDFNKMHKEIKKFEEDARKSVPKLDKRGIANYVIGSLWSELERTRNELERTEKEVKKLRKTQGYAPKVSYLK
jgi:hypothetical protein